MAVSAESSLKITQAYIALFGRAPEPEGLNYWAGKLESGTPLSNIYETMFATPQARAFYPAGLTKGEIVTQFYRNVLGREPDNEGKDFWTAKLNKAPEAGPVFVEIVDVVSNYNGTNVDGVASAALFSKRSDLAKAYTNALETAGINGTNDIAVQISLSVFAGVSSTSDVQQLIAGQVTNAVTLTQLAIEQPSVVNALVPKGDFNGFLASLPPNTTAATLIETANAGGGTPAPTFTVTNGTGADVGKWTVGTQNGNVTVTAEGVDLVFTPATGTAVRVAASDITKGLVVDGITLSGSAATFNAKHVTGSGQVSITGADTAQTLNISTTGNNTITGGKGGDQITLGNGADTLVVNGNASPAESDSYALKRGDTSLDAIFNFNLGSDKLVLPGAGRIADSAELLNGATGVANLTITGVTAGIVQFGGAAAGNVSPWDMVLAVLNAAGTNKITAAIRDEDDTLVIQTDGVAGAQTSDIVVDLQGTPASNLNFIEFGA